MEEQQKTIHISLGLEGGEMRFLISLFLECVFSGAHVLGRG